ncbi:hypothetical protein SAMN05216325_108113 [Nitrosomonas marina]|uniref:Uncharacterized protein n=1 Tax=Nitrosomonas marina TaxID=917 RepID=A0A1H8E3P6_9PROT|nr:hypothetical protein SAMN05216325_108113 [Nitrosomonas marina]
MALFLLIPVIVDLKVLFDLFLEIQVNMQLDDIFHSTKISPC